MANLTKLIIERVESAQTVEDLDGWIWQAGDLLAKTHVKEHHSGFVEIDDEHVSSGERDQLQSALLEALNRNSDPRFVSQILDALGCGRDQSLKQLYVDYLARYAKELKDSNRVMYAALIALRDLGEPVFKSREGGKSSYSVNDVTENVRQADRYLEKRQIVVPW